MKRSKEIIINRRIMHRYQEKYKLWRHIVLFRPLLINTNTEGWDENAWLEYTKAGVIIFKDEPTAYRVALTFKSH